MRFVAYLGKLLKESVREWGVLLLVLLMPAIFVLICGVYFHSGVQSAVLLVVDADRGTSARALVERLAGPAAKEFGLQVRIGTPVAESDGEALLRKGKADMMLCLPEGFSRSLEEGRTPRLTVYGDMTSPKYMLLIAYLYSSATEFAVHVSGLRMPLEFREITIADSGAMNTFSAIVPAIVIFSLLTLLFPSAAAFIREVEKGTIRRLRLTRLSTFEFVSGISLVQVLFGVLCVGFTIAMSYGFGYRTHGSVLAVLLTGILSALSVTAFGLLTAVFCRSVRDVMIIGNFPYFLILMFSGVIPLPAPEIVNIHGVGITANHLLPFSYGVRAMSRILNSGAGIGDVLPELGILALSTAVVFTVAILLFRSRHMRLG
jgi:ABC-2 type transport system permease protein